MAHESVPQLPTYQHPFMLDIVPKKQPRICGRSVLSADKKNQPRFSCKKKNETGFALNKAPCPNPPWVIGTSGAESIPFLNGIFAGQIMQALCHRPCHPARRLCALCWCVTSWFRRAPPRSIACLPSAWLPHPTGSIRRQGVRLPDFVEFLRLCLFRLPF